MDIELDVVFAHVYFERLGKEIDWEETGNKKKIPLAQHEALQNILTCECSIFCLRRAHGNIDGGISDSMVAIRRRFIDEYEEKYEKYIEVNNHEFY